MKISELRLFQIIKEEIQKSLCPPATQGVELNTENRNKTRDRHDYGPMNPLEESTGYWEEYSEKWSGATPEEAMKMRCANCVAFDISDRMKSCIPISEMQYGSEEEVDPMDLIDQELQKAGPEEFPGMPEDYYAGFGYCWMHHFKCHSARSCDTWAGGGPIDENEESLEWQEKAGM